MAILWFLGAKRRHSRSYHRRAHQPPALTSPTSTPPCLPLSSIIISKLTTVTTQRPPKPGISPGLGQLPMRSTPQSREICRVQQQGRGPTTKVLRMRALGVPFQGSNEKSLRRSIEPDRQEPCGQFQPCGRGCAVKTSPGPPAHREKQYGDRRSGIPAPAAWHLRPRTPVRQGKMANLIQTSHDEGNISHSLPSRPALPLFPRPFSTKPRGRFGPVTIIWASLDLGWPHVLVVSFPPA
jgi:hypothetical protein